MLRWTKHALGLSSLLSAAALAGFCSALGCDDTQAVAGGPAASASGGPLSPEVASKVLVKVGSTAITVGEYAAALERMDQFERLRYQGADRRQRLLEEMVNLELLAMEAKRRGLDQKPETRQHLRRMLKDEMREEVRSKVPKPEDIPEADVRVYFEANKSEFNEPERRRVAHIAIASRDQAERVLKAALVATPDEWGRLVLTHSLDKPKDAEQNAALELAGDLGIVGPPDHPDGAHPRVPEALRKAVFEVAEVGQIHPKVIEAGGQFHIVRMISMAAARQRTFVDAERTARVAVSQKLVREAEERFEKELRQRFPVKVDEEALKQIELPPFTDPAKALEPTPSASPAEPSPTARLAPSAPPASSNAHGAAPAPSR